TLSLIPVGHPKRSLSLTNLAATLSIHFDQLGEMADLEEAITLDREALHLRPVGHPGRSINLSNLAATMSTYFDQPVGQMADLEEAIKLFREALSLRPVGHPDRSGNLSNLAACLLTHFHQSREMADLEEAIALHREALSLTPVAHPYRSDCLSHLAFTLETHFDELGKVADLDEAISLYNDAYNTYSPGRPDKIHSIRGLARLLLQRESQSMTKNDFTNKAWELYEQASDYIYANTTSRLKSTSSWATAAHKNKHESTGTAYEKALGLLEQCLIVRPTLELQHNFFQTVQRISTLTSNTVSWAIEIEQLQKAVQLWERGRGIMWSKMKDYRSDQIEQLRIHDAALAVQFENVTQQLEQFATRSSQSELLNNQHQENKW
ncbi:hypothetical protein FA95DRAFT_208184, partial [Auriscalpium vulgare]